MSIYQAMREPRGGFGGGADGPKRGPEETSGKDESSAKKTSKGNGSSERKEHTTKPQEGHLP